MKDNASKYREKTIKVQGGADYLKVAQRILWFREEKPDWAIQTHLIETAQDHTLAKAEILNPEGKIMATAHKFAAKGHGPAKAYHRESAETGAIGRALGLLGYGTDAVFADDESEDFIADSPVQKKDWDFPVKKSLVEVVPHEYVIPDNFRKFAGLTLAEVDEKEIKDYCNFLMKKTKADGKEVSGALQELIDRVKGFFGD